MIYKMTLKKVPYRAREAKLYYGAVIKEPSEVFTLAHKLLKGQAQEVFMCFHLNVRNIVIGFTEVARGGIESCQVDPRVLFGSALLAGASSIILVHNHPSGEPVASPDDIALDKRLRSGAKILGLTFLDHLIIVDGGYSSMAESGYIDSLDD